MLKLLPNVFDFFLFNQTTLLQRLKNKNIEVEIVSSHYVDPKGKRVRS